MTAFVLDASIALGWMLDRPVPARSSLARKLITAGSIPVVPVLWCHEVSNALVSFERRGRLSADLIKTLMADVDAFSNAVEVDPPVVRASVLIAVARRTNLTVYDAAYVELASRRRLPLATLDDRLQARRSGVELI